MIRRTAIILSVLGLLVAGPAAAQHSFDWETGDRGAMTEIEFIHTFHTWVYNTGSQEDTYTISFVPTMPPVWFSSLCEGPLCYAPYPIVPEFVTATIAPGDSTTIGVNMTPVTNPGWGVAMVTVQSVGNPSLSVTRDFTVISDGVDVLVVDGDPAADPVPYFTDALASTGRSSAHWTKDTMGALADSNLANFETVLWATGNSSTPLSGSDRDALSAYLSGGGQLYLSGSAFAYGMATPPVLTQLIWMQNFLGAQYVADDAGAITVAGVPGDELGDGLAFAITGGDGAGNNDAPDVIQAAGTGALWATYPGDSGAATRKVMGGGRTVFTGFTFEGVSTAADRQLLLAEIMQWLAISGPSAVGDVPSTQLVSNLRAAPNPFNPQTSIFFEIGGSREVPGVVDVYDLRGRAVRRLFAGPLAPGPQSLAWNGRDDDGRGLPSGVYLALVRAGEATSTVKMTLSK